MANLKPTNVRPFPKKLDTFEEILDMDKNHLDLSLNHLLADDAEHLVPVALQEELSTASRWRHEASRASQEAARYYWALIAEALPALW